MQCSPLCDFIFSKIKYQSLKCKLILFMDLSDLIREAELLEKYNKGFTVGI